MSGSDIIPQAGRRVQNRRTRPPVFHEVADLDLVGWVEPIDNYDALLEHAQVPAGDLKVRSISLEDLIRLKEHLRRLKDCDSLFQ